jgi:hypothetical protein
LISIPAYLIPVVTEISSTSAQEILKSGKKLPKLGFNKVFSKENGDEWVYIFLIAIGMFIVFTMLIIIFILVRMNGLKYQFIPIIKNETSKLV